MNATQVAKQAIDATRPFADILSPAIRYQLAQAHIARWLDAQDEDHRAGAANTFCAAMACLGALLPC